MTISLQISGDLLEKARSQALKEERNVTSLVKYALRKYLDASIEPAKVQTDAATTPAIAGARHEQ